MLADEDQEQSAQSETADRWGDLISEERQAELKALADQQREWIAQPEATRGESHFKDVRLTGADVFWLSAYTLAGPEGDLAAAQERVRDTHQRYGRGNLSALHLEGAALYKTHLEGANLYEAHLEGSNLYMAHLEEADLRGAHLQGARVMEAHLEGATLSGANLEDCILSETRLEGSYLVAAHLKEANLIEAHLEGSDLRGAHLKGADLEGAHLEGADLREAHLEEAVLREAHLEGKRVSAEEVQRLRQWAEDFPEVLTPADLREAFFDTTTNLEGVILGSAEFGFVHVADVRWGGINLADLKWAQPGTGKRRKRLRTVVLGDEWQARNAKHKDGTPKDAETRLADFEAAVRANRQLATTLRGQGLNEDADRFAYRALVLHREVLRQQRLWLRGLGSLLLDLIAGYGYRPLRSVITYVLVVAGFAVGYYLLSNNVSPALSPLDAIVFSVTSFHGRGFSPGEAVTLHNPLTVLAAGEAIIGLLIQITFIVTLTQRFLAK